METKVNEIHILSLRDLEYMEYADLHVAQWSRDPSSKVGAILVKDDMIIATGCNQFPDGIENTKERWERPEKYDWVNHAEPTVICNAAREGVSTLGSAMYLNWYPCDICSTYIVQAGIRRVYCDKEPDWDDLKWGDKFKRAKTILKEGGVEVIYMNYDAHRQGNV